MPNFSISTSTPSHLHPLHNIPLNPNYTGYIFDTTPYPLETVRLLNMETIQGQSALVARDDHELDMNKPEDLAFFFIIIICFIIIALVGIAFVGLIVWMIYMCIILIPPPFSHLHKKIPLRDFSRRNPVEVLPEDLEAQVPRYPGVGTPETLIARTMLVCLLNLALIVVCMSLEVMINCKLPHYEAQSKFSS